MLNRIIAMRDKLFPRKRGLTMIEVLVALAILSSALLLGIYPTMFVAHHQAAMASQQKTARRLLADQVSLMRFYSWKELVAGDLKVRGDHAAMTACNPLPIPNPNQISRMVIQEFKIVDMTYTRGWIVLYPHSSFPTDLELAQVVLFVYWRSGIGCKYLITWQTLNCNRGDTGLIKNELGSYCPMLL